MKVSKKDESLARSILWNRLIEIGFPSDRIDERVNEAWPSCLKAAKELNSIANLFKHDLDGFTTEEAIERWSDE